MNTVVLWQYVAGNSNTYLFGGKNESKSKQWPVTLEREDFLPHSRRTGPESVEQLFVVLVQNSPKCGSLNVHWLLKLNFVALPKSPSSCSHALNYQVFGCLTSEQPDLKSEFSSQA